MIVHFKANDRITIVAESEKQTDLFEQVASMQEVFGEEKCGRCGNSNFRFQVRVDDDENKYYELRCQGKDKDGKWCNAKLAYGCHKKGGGLFPKRLEKDENGQTIKDANGRVKQRGVNGWTRWNPETKKEE